MRASLTNFSHALIAYGPWGVFLLAILDSMGVPIPAAMDLLLIGVAASSVKDPRYAYFTALLAVIGSAGGNVALFMAARHGRRMFSKGDVPAGRRRRFQEWFHRYGLLTIFVPAVTPIVPLPLKVFVISAGALHTPFGKFLGVILVARIIRYFGEAYLGLLLGEDAKGFLIHNGWTLAGIALAFTLLLVLVVKLNDRRRQSAV